MAISISRLSSRNNTYTANCQIKSIKSFFRYKAGQYNSTTQEFTKEVSKGNIPEVNQGVYLNFVIRYNWYDIDECYLEIGWEPGYFDNTTSSYKRYGTKGTQDDLSNFYNAANKITTFAINGTPLSISSSGKKNLYSSEMGIFSSTIDPVWIGTIAGVDSSIKNLEIEFQYKNLVNDPDPDSTDKILALVNIIDKTKIKIFKPSRYEHNVIFNQDGLNDFIDKIRKYPVINIEEVASTQWATVSDGQPSIKVTHGNPNFNGSNNYKYVKVGSNVKFLKLTSTDLDNLTDSSYITKVTKSNNAWPTQKTGTFRVSVNNDIFEVPINGLSGGSGSISLGGSLIPTIDSQAASNNGYNLGDSTHQWNVLYARAAIFGNADEEDGKSDAASNVRPYTDGTGSLGNSSYRWGNIYGTTGNFTNLTITNLTINGTNVTSLIPYSKGTTGQFWRGDASTGPSWSNTLVGQFHVNKATGRWSASYTDAAIVIDNNTYTSWIAGDTQNGHIAITTYPGSTDKLYFGYLANDHDANSNAFDTSMTWDGASGDFTATRVFNAVFNDYAEYRTTINLAPGHVVIDQDDGSLVCSTTRLQPGAQVISDTFGHSMGETDMAKTPLAVAGRVLVYTYRPREDYHAGMAVCSAPDGTVDIMTREEIRNYPDCIIGIVSEIPQYETWGSDNVKVDGRIWIKVK